jgi:hypothetical protein
MLDRVSDRPTLETNGSRREPITGRPMSWSTPIAADGGSREPTRRRESRGRGFKSRQPDQLDARSEPVLRGRLYWFRARGCYRVATQVARHNKGAPAVLTHPGPDTRRYPSSRNRRPPRAAGRRPRGRSRRAPLPVGDRGGVARRPRHDRRDPRPQLEGPCRRARRPRVERHGLLLTRLLDQTGGDDT